MPVESTEPVYFPRVAKPDEKAHKQATNECEKRISALREKLAKAQTEISSGAGAAGSDKSEYQISRAEKKQAVDDLFSQKKIVGDQRNAVLDQIKKLQANIKKRGEAVKTSKDKLPFRSLSEIDDQLAFLERQLSSGSVKQLFEEKRIVQEISNLNKSRKILESFTSQQSTFDDDKQEIEALRTKLESIDPLRASLNKQLDAAKANLAAFEAARKEAVGSMSDLFATKNSIKADLDEEFAKVRALRTEFKEQSDAYFNHMRSERERKNEEYAIKKKEERNARLAADALAEREEAEIPAYTDEINVCNNLIKHFTAMVKGTTAVEKTAVTQKAALPTFEGMIVMKKDREEDFMMMGGKKSNKKSKQSASTKALKLDFELIDQLGKLKLEIPASAAQVPVVIEKLAEKREEFLAGQDAATAANKKKAEEKIAALALKAEDLAGEEE